MIPQKSEAVSIETATFVADAFNRIKKPDKTSTDFQHWTYNIAGYTVLHCWHEASLQEAKTKHSNKPTSKDIAKISERIKFKGPTRTGTFTLPESNTVEQLCSTIATEGFNPTCTLAFAEGKEVVKDTSLPHDYVQLGNKWQKPVLNGGLYCNFVRGVSSTRQFFAANLTATWLEYPKRKKFMTASGEKTLTAGTIMIKAADAIGINGLPYEELKTAVITEQWM